MTIPAFAPGCFGSALLFKKKDLICSNCQFASACEPMHLQAAVLLREKMGLAPMIEKETPAIKASILPDPLVMNLPKKVQTIIHKLDTGNYDVVGKLQRGVNPFGAALPFMMVVCHVLLRVTKPVDRNLLSIALAKKFEWQKSTADESARIAICALMHVGAIVSNDGLISIRRET